MAKQSMIQREVKREYLISKYANKREILNILKQAKENNCKIVVTEKDYYRIKKYNFDGFEQIIILLNFHH